MLHSFFFTILYTEKYVIFLIKTLKIAILLARVTYTFKIANSDKFLHNNVYKRIQNLIRSFFFYVVFVSYSLISERARALKRTRHILTLHFTNQNFLLLLNLHLSYIHATWAWLGSHKYINIILYNKLQIDEKAYRYLN
jgi:hypothetical protein